MAKRVLVYTNHYYPEQFKVNDVVDWLKEAKYEIRVVTGMPNYPEGKVYPGYSLFSRKLFENKGSVKINRLPLISRGSGSRFRIFLNYISYFISSSIFTLYLIIFVKKYEFILVHHTSPFFIAIHPIFYKFFKSSKNILWDLDIWPETLVAMDIIKNKVLLESIKRVVYYIYKSYDQVLISSLGLTKTIQMRISKEKINFFPNWADMNIEQANISDDDFNLFSNDSLKIMYLGNIGEAQDFKSIINSIKILEKKDITWYFVGGGRYKSKFQNLIKLKGLTSCVKIIPYQNINNVFALGNQSDLLLLPLLENDIFRMTIPAKLQTYMCIGKPIIGMISGETNKFINTSKIGIAVDSGDYVKLAEELNNILKNKYDLKKFSLNSQKLYSMKFNSALRKKQILKLFNTI